MPSPPSLSLEPPSLGNPCGSCCVLARPLFFVPPPPRAPIHLARRLALSPACLAFKRGVFLSLSSIPDVGCARFQGPLTWQHYDSTFCFFAERSYFVSMPPSTNTRAWPSWSTSVEGLCFHSSTYLRMPSQIRCLLPDLEAQPNVDI